MTTLKGLFPDPKPVRRKNFIQENAKNLKRIEQLFHSSKTAKDYKLPFLTPPKVSSKYESIGAKVNSIPKESKSDNVKNLASRLGAQRLSNDHEGKSGKSRSASHGDCAMPTLKTVKPSHVKQKTKQSKVPLIPNLEHGDSDFDNICCDDIKHKSKGIQTIDSDDINDLYSEGTIRYPSRRGYEDSILEEDKDEANDVKKTEEVELTNKNTSPIEVEHSKDDKHEPTIASKLVMQLNNGVLPPTYRKGVVPKYLKERKEALLKEQMAKAAAYHPDCPEGHVPLPDSERLETLQMLQKNYQEIVNELNMLPIRSDTLRCLKRKIEIEKQLCKLEEAIKVFSRPKVYVKTDA